MRRAIAIAEVTEAAGVLRPPLQPRRPLRLADGAPAACPSTARPGRSTSTSPATASTCPTAKGEVRRPPAAARAEDVTAVWDALRTGVLSTVCTDHLPTTLARKMEPGHTFATVPPGMANLETQMPMLYHDGVRTGRISLPKMVEALCTNPARIAGLAPRKGTIAPGADADIVVFDPRHTRTVRAAEMQSAADYDIFDGQAITGWPRLTISRGEVVFEDGNVVGQPGRGRLAPRSRFSML
ncbi:MAG: amidohydrolase family protein [Dehalococcoidia bacterium]